MGVDVCVCVCGSYTAFLLLECCLIIISRDKIILLKTLYKVHKAGASQEQCILEHMLKPFKEK